jgi:hypothetical protein
MAITSGATKSDVEKPILRCLSSGSWKCAGEIKDFVARYGGLPSESKKSLKGRPAESQSNNAVQNALSPSRSTSLTGLGHVEHSDFYGYRITLSGRDYLAWLEDNERILNELFDGQT